MRWVSQLMRSDVQDQYETLIKGVFLAHDAEEIKKK